MQLKITPKDSWLKTGGPTYIFGPCSAESREQVMGTAELLSKHFDDIIFRGSLWKPRTRPGNFEGIGNKGLDWLIEVKEKFGYQVTTEVANAKHVEACLKANIDILWIGARTTVNPFSVQEIAEALQGVDVPVMIKNPINPDLSLWIGAIERIHMAGINKIAAIHRGFHYTDNMPYRNVPNWDIAIELKSKIPDLPIICDASHISGRPELIPQVSQKAMDMDMDGLMIETHLDPPSALSDKEQQITPDELQKLIADLEIRHSGIYDKETKDQMAILRNKIDTIDDHLWDLLANRLDIARQIGVIKKDNQVTILQVERWEKIIQRSLQKAKGFKISSDFIMELLKLIHDESIRQQTLVMNIKDKKKNSQKS